MKQIVKFIIRIITGVLVITLLKNFIDNIDDLQLYTYYIISILLIIFLYIITKYRTILNKFFGNLNYASSSVIVLILGYIILKESIFTIFNYINVEVSKLHTNIEILIDTIFKHENIVYFEYILLLLSLFVIILLINCFCCRNYNEKKGFLLPDTPIDDEQYDKLGAPEKAESFANIVYNNGSSKSFIFGLIAPWGYGKTSFLKLFKKGDYINTINYKNPRKIKDECIVIDFNPWYFEGDNDLLEKFLNHFKKELNNKTSKYLPELNYDLGFLLQLLEKNSKNILGLSIGIEAKDNLETLKNKINISLKKLNKKIIIIVDDLDRISDNKLKSIFKIIDLCKDFYNTNFILCYDPNNLNNIEENLIDTKEINAKGDISVTSEEVNNKNFIDFISKIINVEYSLLPSHSKLRDYFIDTFINNNEIEFSDNSKDGIEKGINNLFNINNYRIFGKYISNLRGIKRVYNLIISLIGDNEDRKHYIKEIFDINRGIRFDDFIKLMILKSNFPDLFIDVYQETNLDSGKIDIWSSSQNKYKFVSDYNFGSYNSETLYYTNQFLIDKLNQLSIEKQEVIKNIFPIHKLTKNSSGKKVGLKYNENEDFNDLRFHNNLEKHLHIINFDFDDFDNTIIYDNFIQDNIEQFKDSKSDLQSIVSKIEKKYDNKGINSFKDIIKHSINNWDNRKEKSIELIDYMIDNFYQYSLNGLIDGIYIDIEFLLEKSIPRNNSKIDKLLYIGDLMYGEGNFKDKGVIERFFGDNWGVIGLYINLGFMYYIHSERDTLYNYRRGITGTEKLNMPNMFYSAKICRYIYSFFKSLYIDKQKNIFEEIDNIPDNKFDYEKGVDIWSTRYKDGIVGFIIYQLTTAVGSFDYYKDKKYWNEYGDQEGGIKKELNKYYFDFCFKGKGIKYFVEYLAHFIELEKDRFGENDKNIHYKLNDLLSVFEKERLIKIFKDRKEDIDKFIKNNSTEIAHITRYHSSSEGDVEIKVDYKEFWNYFNINIDKITLDRIINK
ncbi:KAP family NTPase [Candidatus Gracilibacteria bacterium]|nr:KAP family NTPase [Candidatus Gracilibacteria bacterium]